MWARKSTDNGATWLADMEFQRRSQPSAGTTRPEQSQPSYAGDYDYGSALRNKHFTSWVDGRVIISGQSQQDTFFDTGATRGR